MTGREFCFCSLIHTLFPLLPDITIGFLDRNNTYDEGESAVIVILLSGQIACPIQFSVEGGSFSETGSFEAPTPVFNMIFFVPLPDDNIALEPPQVITLSLSVPGNTLSQLIGISPQTTNITILDNDCKYNQHNGMWVGQSFLVYSTFAHMY